jgi:predicted permease
MASFLQDVRYGLRLLAHQPGFTLAATLVLALGIGANTAMFTLVNGLLLKPRIGGVDAELVGVFSRERTAEDNYRGFSFAEYDLLRERHLFASISGHSFGLIGIKEGDVTRRAFADIITADYFQTFGVQPVIGRTFTPEEARPGADIPVAILSHVAWQRLGGDASVLARTIEVNGRQFSIVGVAPKAFGGSIVLVSPELFVPTGVYDTLAFDVVTEGRSAQLSDIRQRDLILVARMKPGVTAEAIAPALEIAARQYNEIEAGRRADFDLLVAPLSRMSVSTRPQEDDELAAVTVFLLSFSGIVLLIASFNVANMLFARGRARQREFAIRLAIGGSRLRIARQVLTESLLLALVGGAAGIMLSWWSLRALVVALPSSFPLIFALDPAPDTRVLVATLAFCLAGTFIAGLGPSFRLARLDTLPDLKGHALDDTGGRRGWRGLFSTRDLLVMGQLALTLVMLTSAGLFVRGAVEAAKADPGFTLDRGIIVNTDSSLSGYTQARTRELYASLLARFRAVPGVESASFGSLMPFSEFNEGERIQRAGPPLRADDPAAAEGLVAATTTLIGADYFRTLGIPLRAGREFTAADEMATSGERIAIIDETLARRLFGQEGPIGALVQRTEPYHPPGEPLGATVPNPPPDVLRIVGVVGGIRTDLFESGPQPHIYMPFGRGFRSNMYFHLRTRSASAEDESAMLPAVRQIVRDIDPLLPIVSLETRPAFRARNLVLWMITAGARLMGVLALAALAVAVIGVYGVKAYLVARRTREIGIRMALGASPRRVVGLVFREGLVLATIGIVAGLLLSIVAGQLVRGMLFQGRSFDVAVVVIAAAALLLTVALATWIPARRATRIAPTHALKTE